MAAGLPVITTPVGSNRETVTDGATGLLVEPNDDAQLLDALRTLTADANKRFEMGLRGRIDARARMDAARNAERVLTTLEEVAS